MLTLVLEIVTYLYKILGWEQHILTNSKNRTPTKSQDTTQTEPLSARQRLAVAASEPKSRKRKRISTTDGEEEGDEAATFRALDRATGWNSFLFFTNDLWQDVLKGVYGSGLIIDSVQAQQARSELREAAISPAMYFQCHGQGTNMDGEVRSNWSFDQDVRENMALAGFTVSI